VGIAQLVIGIVTAIGALAGLVAIPIQYGRRHRLRLAIEVREGIADGDREEWDEMIRRDAKAIIQASYRSRTGLAALLVVFGVACGVVGQAVSNHVLQTVLTVAAFTFLGAAFALVISDAATGRGRAGKERSERIAVQRRAAEEASKQEEDGRGAPEIASRLREALQLATKLREEQPALQEVLDPLIEVGRAQVRLWDSPDPNAEPSAQPPGSASDSLP